MGNRTLLERFACTNESVLVETINRYSARMQLEILSIAKEVMQCNQGN